MAEKGPRRALGALASNLNTRANVGKNPGKNSGQDRRGVVGNDCR